MKVILQISMFTIPTFCAFFLTRNRNVKLRTRFKQLMLYFILINVSVYCTSYLRGVKRISFYYMTYSYGFKWLAAGLAFAICYTAGANCIRKDRHQIKTKFIAIWHKTIEQIDSGLSDGKHRIRWYFILYTALFVLVCSIVFCWYFLPGKLFIYQGDGLRQHYKALVYYAEYMRSVIRDLLHNHQFILPEWDMAFGEGNDILQSLQYYVIGDPFAVFSVFIPKRFLWIYYDFMVLLRLYLSGVAFSCLCFYTKKNIGRCAVMAGALSYVFCSWGILNAARHPFFLNPMLYFPMIILGIEKLLKKEKTYLLTVSVFLAAVSNFYFFYVIVLMTAAYVAVRLVTKYRKNFKFMLWSLLCIGGWSVLGTMMGAVILLPMCFAFLNDTRMAYEHVWHLVYPLSYYSRLPGIFFYGDSYWLHMGYAAPVILAVFLLFLQKGKNSVLKGCFLVCSVIILIPALGQLLNGMSYMSNKWCWAFALLCTYIFAVMWPDLMSLKFREAEKLFVCLCIFFFSLMMLEYSRTLSSFACIGIAFMFLFVVFPFHMKNPQTEMLGGGRRKQLIALMLVIVGVCNVSFFKNAAATSNYAKYGMKAEDVEEELTMTEAAVIRDVAEQDGVTGFYRYSGRSLTTNANILAGLSSTQYYWSISNPYFSDFKKQLELREPESHSFKGDDDRTSLITLSSVLYYAVPSGDKAPLPYGFTFVDEFNVNKKYKIYCNDYVLPVSYVYNKVISEDAWEALSAVEKQEAMLQAVMLVGYGGETQDGEVAYTSLTPDYSIECSGTGITLEPYGFVVTAANSSATISFEGMPNSETYFSIHDLDFDGVSTYELYFGDEKYDPLDLFTETRWNLLSYEDRQSIEKSRLFWTEPTGADLTLKASSGVSKTINYMTEDDTKYNDRHDFTVNLDYAEDAVTSITLTFSAVGVYSFDSIEVICQPMDKYAGHVSALKEHGLEDIHMGTDTVKGTVSLEEASVLCLAIPYSTGWTAYVDGEEVELYQANVKYMALVLDAGVHEVELVYHTPYLRLGAAVSGVGFVVCFILILGGQYRKRRQQTDVHDETWFIGKE